MWFSVAAKPTNRESVLIAFAEVWPVLWIVNEVSRLHRKISPWIFFCLLNNFCIPVADIYKPGETIPSKFASFAQIYVFPPRKRPLGRGTLDFSPVCSICFAHLVHTSAFRPHPFRAFHASMFFAHSRILHIFCAVAILTIVTSRRTVTGAGALD